MVWGCLRYLLARPSGIRDTSQAHSASPPAPRGWVRAGWYRAGLATRQGCLMVTHAVGAWGGEDRRENKPARSSIHSNHAACRSIRDLVSLVLTLPVSPVLLASRVLVVPVWGSVVPVFPVLPVVAHLAVVPRWLKRDRW
jgi:hypothetical protein